MSVVELNTKIEQSLGISSEPDGEGKLYGRGLCAVVALGGNTPPVAPAVRTRYVCGTAPTGAWTGRANALAYYNSDGSWSFSTPSATYASNVSGHGWLVLNLTDGLWYGWNGAWSPVGDASAAAAALAAANAAQSTANTALANAATALAAANEADDTADTAQADATTALANAATALAAANEADDTADTAQTTANTALANAAAGATAISAINYELGVSQSSARLDLYCDVVAGSDANSGLSTSAPVQTWARLLELLPHVIYRPVLVHMASGTLDLGSSGIPYLIGSKLLGYYADPAWDPRADLFTVVATGTAAATTGASSVVAAGARTLNAERGMSIRFTTGAAAGQKRTIQLNSTTAWQPNRPFSPAPAAGDTYEVFTNNAILNIQGTSVPFTVDGNSSSVVNGVVFSGVDFTVSGGGTSAQFGANYHQFYGCRARSAVQGIGALDGCHIDAGNVLSTAVADQLGLPQTMWDGWGLVADNTSTGFQTAVWGSIQGSLVSKGTSSFAGDTIMTSGHLQAVTLISQPSAKLNVTGPSSTHKTTIGDAADTTTKVAVNYGTAVIATNAIVQNASATIPTITVERAGALQIGSSVTGGNTNASGLSIRCRYGGEVRATGTPAFGKTGVADWQCEATSGIAFGAGAVLTAAGTNIIDATKPYSAIVRVS